MSKGFPTSVRGTGAECKKFVPNIFNKSKCSSCFKQKEEHSAEALDSNRVTRKICKCGYLFVAPGWDFSNPLNRTKRWQRRWFVLYDDDELTYSVDEHPETVPQARIDMTRVLEVAAADDITGHPYSLAITLPEGVSFVKGTCREETRWWGDVLQVYSKNKGRHKRNATYPGGQSTIVQITTTARSNTSNLLRPRFNSCRSEPRNSSTSWKLDASNNLCNSVFSLVDCSISSVNTINKHSVSYDNDINVVLQNNTKPLKHQEHIQNDNSHSCKTSSSSSILNTISDITDSIETTTVNSLLTTATTTTPTSTSLANEPSQLSSNSDTTIGLEKPPIDKGSSYTDSKKINYRDQLSNSNSPSTREKLHKTDEKVRKKLYQRTTSQCRQQLYKKQQDSQQTQCNSIININEILGDEHESEQKDKLCTDENLLTQVKIKQIKSRTSEATKDTVDAATAVYQDKLIRGDPDGCVLDISGIRYSPISELRLDLPVEDLLNIKKGWLMKQSFNTEWNKYWCVLRGTGLLYYRDPNAEDKGIMDGKIDLNTVTAVTPIQVARNYGFQTVTWAEQRSTIFSAITAGIRSSWISAIREAANLPNLENSLELHIVYQNSQPDISSPSSVTSVNEREKDAVVPSTSIPPSRSILFSSDEEYRTASESGKQESGDWTEIPSSPPLIRNGKWLIDTKTSSCLEKDQCRKHERSELPPSPPLTRTALSRVKARSRSNSRSRICKRSRSSPPTSRHSTLDSIKSEDLVMACYKLNKAEQSKLSNKKYLSKNSSNDSLIFDLSENHLTMLQNQIDNNQSSPNPLLVIVERQENEIEDLKSEINSLSMKLVNAENKISRLKQHKTETILKEKEIDDLLSTIQNKEQQRNQYLDDLDKMKKLYKRDKEFLECKLIKTETILRETTDRCQMLTNELSSSHVTQEHLQVEITTLSDRLAQGIEENERLYSRVRDLEGKTYFSSSKERGKSFDSLSDLTNIDLDINLNALDKDRVMEEYEELKSRFEKAILEIRAMRKELREAHAVQDVLELQIFAQKQEVTSSTESNQAQIQLMAARIQDLTNKLGSSEKQVRNLKQKLNKVETRDKRRSLSLKGRESLQFSQELEDKLLDLEKRLCTFEQSKNVESLTTVNTFKQLNSNSNKEKKKENFNLNRNMLRRKSLDSMTCSESMKVLIRLSALETKVLNITDGIIEDVEKDSSECNKVCASYTNEVFLEVLSRLRKLERVVSKSKKKLEKCLGSTHTEEKSEKCLQIVNEILDSCIECKNNEANSQIIESIRTIVSELNSVLKNNVCNLMNKHEQLVQTGELSDKEKIKLIVQRVAFEFILLKHIKNEMERTLDKSAVLSEFVETSQLISNLKLKVNGTKSKIYQNTSYIQYLTKVLANKLVFIGGISNTLENSIEISQAEVEGLNFLVHKQKEINEIVKKYKNEKLKFLAQILAIETYTMSNEEELSKQLSYFDKKLIKDKRIQKAWTLAQETVNKELIQVQVSRFIMHCDQIYEKNISPLKDTCLNFHSFQDIDLKSWVDKAQHILKQEIEYTIYELTITHKDFLIQLKKKNNIDNVQYNLTQLLSNYTDILAQKALIDAKMILLQENMKNRVVYTEKTFLSSLNDHEDILFTLFNENDTFEKDAIHDTEYIYLQQQFSKKCESKIFNKQPSQEQIKNIAQTLMDMVTDIDNLKRCLKNKMNQEIDNVDWPELTIIVTDWNSISEKCSEIRKQIKQLTDYIKNIICKQCIKLQKEIQWLTNEHTKELEELRKNQVKDLMDIKENWDNQRNSLTTQYEHEAAVLRDRARRLEHRLNAIDFEHSAHEFRAVYQRSVSTELDTDAEIRKRYKEEIKQLRALCEKGLLAMENSHRRIISELEEKHQHELENLRIEKEQALSEETQATLAALDAMRKAHEHEVQKEIAKFKQEFIKQVQGRGDIGLLHKEHEQEMEEIKQEILSLSAKYSSKCVESAALEEKVGVLTKQIAQAQQHILKLDVKNKELHSHLFFETNNSSLNDTIQFFKSSNNEISEQKKENCLLKHQVKHKDELPSSTNSTKSSPAITYSPVYSSQEIQSNHESVDESSKMNGLLFIDVSKNWASQMKKPELSDQLKSPFLFDLDKTKYKSFSHSSNTVTTENISNEKKIKKEEAIKMCNGIITPRWGSLRSTNSLPLPYQVTEDTC